MAAPGHLYAHSSTSLLLSSFALLSRKSSHRRDWRLFVTLSSSYCRLPRQDQLRGRTMRDCVRGIIIITYLTTYVLQGIGSTRPDSSYPKRSRISTKLDRASIRYGTSQGGKLCLASSQKAQKVSSTVRALSSLRPRRTNRQYKELQNGYVRAQSPSWCSA